MTRFLALALAVGAMAAVRELRAEALTPGPVATALALGFALMGASVAGDALRRFHLPRLTGYLIFGVIVGPYVANLITESMAAELQVVTGLATTLIAFIAGLTLSVERLGARLAAIARMTVATLGVALAGMAALAWLVWPWLPIAPDAVGLQRLVMLQMLVVMVVSFSPTMTAAVVADSGARGRLSDTVLAMVVLADLVILVLFSVSMELARVVFDTGAADSVNVLARLAWELGGAVAFGVLIGVLVALYLRYIGREITLVLLAVCAVLSQVGTTQQLQPLLAAVAAGVVIENLAVAQGDALRAAVRRGAPPVLVVFFVAVGASLRLDALAAIGFSAIALSAVRIAFIRLGVGAGVRVSGLPEAIGTARGPAWCPRPASPSASPPSSPGSFRAGATSCSCWSCRRSRFTSWSARSCSAAVSRRPASSTRRWPARLVVVSNREPYLHSQEDDGRITVKAATGGVAVALDALMRERGGVWIAHGAGPADQLVVDAADKVMVPPESPSYALRRLWLEEPTFSAYYGGFANEGLWPLCHVVDVRPKFRSEDWAAYQDINARFAAAIHDEIGSSEAPVFIQDYHLALVAPALRSAASGHPHGAVLAHPLALSGSPADLPVAARARGGAAGQRSARVPGRARSAQLPDGGGRRAWRRHRVRVVAGALSAAGTAPSSRCRSVSTTTASRASPPIRRCHRNSSACASCSGCAPTSSGWASIGWTTRRASPNASTPSTR